VHRLSAVAIPTAPALRRFDDLVAFGDQLGEGAEQRVPGFV